MPSRMEGVTKSQMSALFVDITKEVVKRRHALEANAILRTVAVYNVASVGPGFGRERSVSCKRFGDFS